MAMRFTEFLSLAEAPDANGNMSFERVPKGFKLYVQEPYGSGFDPKPVKQGEVLPTHDGHEVEFDHVDGTGKVICVVDGKMKAVPAGDLAGIVLNAAIDVKGRKGFAK